MVKRYFNLKPSHSSSCCAHSTLQSTLQRLWHIHITVQCKWWNLKIWNNFATILLWQHLCPLFNRPGHQSSLSSAWKVLQIVFFIYNICHVSSLNNLPVIGCNIFDILFLFVLLEVNVVLFRFQRSFVWKSRRQRISRRDANFHELHIWNVGVVVTCLTWLTWI